MCFHFLCQRPQRVNLPETVLESFPYNDNLSPKSTRLLVLVRHYLIFYANHLKN